MAESVAELLLRSAAIDGAACRVLDAAPGMPDAVVGFHAQQACEKCIKAVLSAAAVEVPRTHDLARLAEMLSEHGLAAPAEAQWIDTLTPYAVAARYGLVSDGGLDRARALVAVDQFLEWARRIVGGSAAD